MLLGIDANGNGGIDLFVGVDNSGNPNVLRIWDPGAGLNDGPNTSSFSATGFSYTETASNYDFSSVTTLDPSAGTDVNGDGSTDYFLTFGIPFQGIVTQLGTTASGRPAGISINENTALRFIVATTQNSSNINPDVSGLTGLTSPSFVYSDPTTPASLPVPEGPSATLLLAAGLPGGMDCYYPTSQRKPLRILVH